MRIVAVHTPIFKSGQDLPGFLFEYLSALHNGEIVVITSKIVALAQGRSVSLSDVTKRQLIEREADEYVETPWCLLTRRGREWCANAGVDESNADGKLILLPSDVHAMAKDLREKLMRHTGASSLAVIITDTRLVPLQSGTMGMALAWAGLEPLLNYIGSPDLFGRELKMTKANVVHVLAAAAVLAMGEGAEGRPLAVISDAPVTFSEGSGASEDLAVSPSEDLYAALYHLKKRV